jgi:hypothetical protein
MKLIEECSPDISDSYSMVEFQAFNLLASARVLSFILSVL